MAIDPKVLSIGELHKLTRAPRNGSSGDDREKILRDAGELWECLVETVRSPTVSDQHMTAACNALCFVVRANIQHHDEASKARAYDQKTWQQMFSAARAAFASGKTKPALQVLDTLHYLAEMSPYRARVTQKVEEAATEMVTIILSHHPRRSIKEACIVLYFFLRKLSDFMSFSDVLQQVLNYNKTAFVQICRDSGIHAVSLGGCAHPQWFAFVLALLLAVRITESKSATLKLLTLLCGLPMSTYGVDVPSILSKSIDAYSVADEAALEAVTRDVLPSVLTSQDVFATFLLKQQSLGKSNISAILVVLTLLQYGKSRSYVLESELPSIISAYMLELETDELVDSPYDSFGCLLSHGSAPIRLAACELLLSSTSPSIPFPPGLLCCMTANLKHLHDDTDAYHRGELLSILRRFLVRIQQSHRALRAGIADPTHLDMLHEYDHFYDHYLCFLRREIAAGNSYPRHILALQVLSLASDGIVSQDSIFQKKIVSDQAVLIDLMQLVLDPYEDVRALAAEIIAKIAGNNPQQFDYIMSTLDPMRTVSQLAATTNRADHADALGRVLSLALFQSSICNRLGSQKSAIDCLRQLSDELESHVLLLQAFNVSDKFPLHGFVLGVKYAIQRLPKGSIMPTGQFIQTLLDICRKLWTLSQSHLCVDSPEMESESLENDDSGPKDRLAYAWRALRDSNLMMQAMLEHFAPDHDLLEHVGDTCLNQLSLLRHRGAFSTVAQTFVLCCQKARESKDIGSRNLVDRWFSEALSELEKQADKLTRRSAGLPAIFAAVFDPLDKAKFTFSFEQLVSKAMEKVDISDRIKEERLRLPQVHALNCIKDIMTSSRFRVLTEPLVVYNLNLAANCMSSNIWAIKNCGLMLLRASINRLDPDTGLGISEAGIKQRASSKTERRPVDVAVNFLNASSVRLALDQALSRSGNQDTSHASTEALFAGLDILSRLYIESNELSIIKQLVTEQLGHPLWHIRAQTSRLLTILTPPGKESTFIRDQLSDASTAAESSFNRVHGLLMLTKCLVQKLYATNADSIYISEIVPFLEQTSRSRIVTSHAACMAEWLSITDQLIATANTDTEIVYTEDLLNAAEQIISHPTFSIDEPVALYRRHLAAFLLRCYTLFGRMYVPLISLLRSCEDDVFTYTLTTFRPHSDANSVLRYLEILTILLEDTTTQQRCAVVMQAFTMNIQGQIEIDAAKLARFTELLDFGTPTSRDLLNNQLVFYAVLCRFAWIQNNEVSLDSLAKQAGSFGLHLRSAANDEIEYDTRYSTISALQQWKDIEGLGQMLRRLFERTQQMEILSILYDLLNDDDEDIRAEAAEVVAALTDEHDSFPASTMRSLCPAASRRKLRGYLFGEFSDTQSLQDECLRRVLGSKMAASRRRLRIENETQLRRAGVGSYLQPIFEAMRELFIEEKQNLYIDEIAELENWAIIFSKTSFSNNAETMHSLAAWSINGADLLNSIFEGKHHWSSSLFDVGDSKGGSVLQLRPRVMFGTSLTESLELLVARVIVGLRISSKADCIALKLLQKNCLRLNVSQAVLSAFTWLLD